MSDSTILYRLPASEGVLYGSTLLIGVIVEILTRRVYIPVDTADDAGYLHSEYPGDEYTMMHVSQYKRMPIHPVVNANMMES